MEKALKEYNSSLDKSFRKNKKVPIEKLIEPSRRGSVIPKGTLVVMPFVSGQIRLKILDKATQDKGFSIPLKILNKGKGQSVSADYLAWFLTCFRNRYLMHFVAVQPRRGYHEKSY